MTQTLTVTLDDDGPDPSGILTLALRGDVRWNDRLAIGRLAGAVHASAARRLRLDATLAREADRGALIGVTATARRLALLSGLAFDVLAAAPAATDGAVRGAAA